MAKLITKRQKRVLLWVTKYIEREGIPPTRTEIARGLKFKSPNAAEDHLKALEIKGFIEIKRGMSRGIRVL